VGLKKKQANVIMKLSHSSTPKTESLWAFQIAIARKDLEDVTATFPDESAEYIRSLSSDKARAVTGKE